jgi:hypothetical protein
MKGIRSNLYICGALLRRDMRIMYAKLLSTIIDSMYIVFFVYLIYACLLPSMGMQSIIITSSFLGTLFLVLVNVGYDRMILDSLDFEGARYIDYQVGLPLKGYWLISKYLMSYMIDLFIASFPVFLLGRVLFGSLLDFSNAHWFLFGVVYFLTIVFLSALMLGLAAAKSFRWIRENAWPRILLPMTLLGCTYYPWRAVATVAPWWSRFVLLVPSTYVVEGLRATAVGSDLYLPWYVSIIALSVLSLGALIFLYSSMRRHVPF